MPADQQIENPPECPRSARTRRRGGEKRRRVSRPKPPNSWSWRPRSSQTRSVQLRVVTPDDWEAWRGVRLRALADAADAFGSSLSDWESADESRWRRRLSEVPFNLIAVRAGHAIGQASGTAVDVRARIELISMWVAPEARGRGVADALVAAVAGYGSDVGAAAIRLSVRRHNERAIRFYTRINFELADEPADEPAEIAMVRSTRT